MTSNYSIDWEDCLRLNNNKPTLAHEILMLFKNELPLLQQQITQAYQQKNIQELAFHLHKLHGACCYCGTKKLKDITEKIEHVLKTEKLAQLDTLLMTLHTEIKATLHELNTRTF